MMNIAPSRIRPENRVPSDSDKTPDRQSQTYLAPIAGWISNESLAAQERNAARVLDNFWPTATGITPRGGLAPLLGLSGIGAFKALFSYDYSEPSELFAANDRRILAFDAHSPSYSTVVVNQTSGDYSALQIKTDGGGFLILVNGANKMLIYDGTTWQRVTSTSRPFAITKKAGSQGRLDTARFSHVWSYRNRLFFIEKDSLNAWYLGINAVAGEAAKLPLEGLFQLGGTLIFGATWSSDSGAGMDDRCVFATDKGEFAVFSGSNPGNANNWTSRGVYEIGEPLDKQAVIRVGGELIIATKAGLIPLSAAVQQDKATLKLTSLSRNIEPDWNAAMDLAGNQRGWSIVKWASRNMLIIAPPNGQSGGSHCFVVNLQTRAWTRFTGWNVSTMAVLDDQLYVGTPDGKIMRGNTGGTDDGALYVCSLCYAFDHLGAPGAIKQAKALRATFVHKTPFAAKLSVATDYKDCLVEPPDAIPIDTSTRTAALWDEAIWDVALWDQGTRNRVEAKWVNVAGTGYVLAPQLQITVGSATKPDIELVSMDLIYETGGVLV